MQYYIVWYVHATGSYIQECISLYCMYIYGAIWLGKCIQWEKKYKNTYNLAIQIHLILIFGWFDSTTHYIYKWIRFWCMHISSAMYLDMCMLKYVTDTAIHISCMHSCEGITNCISYICLEWCKHCVIIYAGLGVQLIFF